jgi:threonine aldolase
MRVDLRSDTVTRPTQGMLDAMFHAQVGDDVFGEDPTVNQLEATAAALFGMESALYCSSGTMSNQVAIKSHTQPGDEVICEKNAHVYIYEGGGMAFNSGCQARPIEGDRGRINAGQVLNLINPDDPHKARTSLVCLEDSSNRGGGSCYDIAEIARIRKVCQEHHLSMHLDGARLFNALVSRGEKPALYGGLFDSISFCLNKGLGCPIGSMLLGSAAFIKKSRRVRKVFGGSLRQAGFMAASGIYALEHHIDRLREDHAKACRIAEALDGKDFVDYILPVETNILAFAIRLPYQAGELAARLREKEVLCLPISPTQIRMVTHLDISEEMVSHTTTVIGSL